jgi:hypothetical protein
MLQDGLSGSAASKSSFAWIDVLDQVEPAKHEHLEALAKIAAGEALFVLEIQVTFKQW